MGAPEVMTHLQAVVERKSKGHIQKRICLKTKTRSDHSVEIMKLRLKGTNKRKPSSGLDTPTCIERRNGVFRPGAGKAPSSDRHLKLLRAAEMFLLWLRVVLTREELQSFERWAFKNDEAFRRFAQAHSNCQDNFQLGKLLDEIHEILWLAEDRQFDPTFEGWIDADNTRK